MSIYITPEYNKNAIMIGTKRMTISREEALDQRPATIALIRKKLATMSAKEKRGMKPAQIEKYLKLIEKQIAESAEDYNGAFYA